MTVRSVLLGLLGACVVCGFTYFNDAVMLQTYFVGNNMPIAVYGGLLLFVVLINPLLGRLRPGAALSGKELAVILALTLAACCVPSSGLLRTLPATTVLPFHQNRIEPGWQQQGVLDMAAPIMLADVTPENHSDVVNGFMQGLARGEDRRHIGLADIPWSAWSGSLAFWLALVLCLWFALIALSVVLHRQWSAHEQLAYPIAAFAEALFPPPGRATGSVVQSRLFWIGLVLIGVIHLNNYAAAHFPDHLIAIRTGFSFAPLLDMLPTMKAGDAKPIFNFAIYPTVVALSFFLAADISFSMGIAPYIYAYINGTFARYGVSLTRGGWYEPKPMTFLNFGSYLGMFVSLLMIGRHYYRHVLRRVMWLASAEHIETAVVWAARVFLVAAALMVILLISAGIAWPYAIGYTALTVVMFTVMSRIMAETGAFFLQSWWFPCTVLAGLLGHITLEPRTLLLLMMVSSVLVIDPREALMPFIVNSFRFLDSRGVHIGRSALWSGGAVVLGLTVAVPATLYFQYDRGMNKTDGWANEFVPKAAFEETVRVKQRLSAQDQLEQAESAKPLERIGHVTPNLPCMIALAAGFIAVLATTAARLRFAHWPLHPVLFLVWTTYPGRAMAASFLCGWLLKVFVTRYGGAGGYQKIKPLMFGLIAGDMIGGALPILIGIIYYAFTGSLPQPYQIMPG